MAEVVSDGNGGLDKSNTGNALSNLYLYYGALERCNVIITEYNKTIEVQK